MTKKPYIMICVLLLWGVLASVSATIWSADNIRIPYIEDARLYVADPDGYVSKEMKDSANYYLARLRKECGVENIFIIVGRVEDGDAFRMAQDVGNKYGVGNKKTRRGLVVVIAVEDHRYFIASGMGLEGKLTDVDCDDIARACIVTNMKDNDPGKAVFDTSKALFSKIKTGTTGIQSVDGEEDVVADNWILIGFILLCIFGLPLFLLVRYVLQEMGIIKKTPRKNNNRRNRRNDHDDFPPIFIGGLGGFGRSMDSSGFGGGSFGGGSFGGGGSGGSW